MDLKWSQLAGRDGWNPALPSDLDSPQTLVLVFAGGSQAQRWELPDDDLSVFDQSIVVGCSTSGEILGEQVIDDSVTVAVIRFDATRLASATARLDQPGESTACGEALAHALAADDLRAVLVLAPGLNVNGSELVRGLTANLPADVLVTGGLAGDGPRFGRTWVLADGTVSSDQAVAVGFYGDHIRLGHGSRGGWEGFGPERVITKSSGNVLYELDGRPALTLYRQYLGDLEGDLPGSGLRFPLAVRESVDADRKLVRTLLAVDDEAMSMTFAGDVPEGWRAQLMSADSDQLLDAADEAAASAALEHDGPVLALAISCVGRRMMFGENVEEELERTAAALPSGALQVGFYSYGELSPSTTGVCELHNQTMTFTTIAEV